LHTDAAGKAFTPEVQAEWDELNAEHAAITERMAHLQAREAKVAELAARPAVTDRGDASAIGVDFQVRKPAKVENIYDLPAHRAAAIKDGDEGRLLRESAIRSIETSRIPAPKGYDVERMREMAQTTLERLDGTEEDGAPRGALAAYYLATGSPTYRRAFGKFAASSPAPALFMPEESAAIHQAETWSKRAFTLGSTGLPVPYQLDPTIMPISNSSVNPYRAIGRVVQTTVKNWRGATSAGITAAYVAEATEATDDTPTLAQPTIDAQRAQAFVPFSIEVDQDWSEVEGEMLREVADAKDDLEATKFTLGTGTNEPFGLIVGATTLTNTGTTGAFVIADLYKMEEALPPRFRPRAEIVGTRFVFNKARQFDTAGGSGVWLDGLQVGLANEVPTPGQIGPRLLGYPAWECSAMDAALTTGSEILVMGQFDPYFTIVDRVGMSADLIPHLVGTNHRPTGQRGLYFMWRNGSKVINAAAFRTLQT
jgi:HK97 family phage major capsid protein